MSRFLASVVQFISGTTAKSAQVNTAFAQVTGGLDNVQAEVNTALRGPTTESATDLPRLPAAATRANTFVQFDASGNPIASSTLQQDLAAGGHKITGLPIPSTATEPVTLQYLTGYSGALMGLPPVAGNVGKFLSTDGVGVSWTSPACPASIPSEPGLVATTDGTGAQPQWTYAQHNLLADPNNWLLTWTSASLSIVFDEFGFHCANTGALTTQTWDHKSQAVAVGSGVNLVTGVDVNTAGVSAGTITALLRYLDAGGATLSESATTAIANGQAFKRFRVVGVTPVSTASVQVIVRFAAVSASVKGIRVRNPKLEQGTQPTPFSLEGFLFNFRSRSQYTWGAGITQVTSTLGDGTTTVSSVRDFRSAAGAQAYDVRMKSTGGTSGTPGKGTLDIESKALRNTGPIGYASELDLGNSTAGAVSVNLQSAAYQKLTLTGNAAISFDSANAPLGVGRYRVKLVQDATGSRVPTWPTGAGKITVNWLQGVSPTVASAAGAFTFVDLYWDGAALFGSWTAWS